jgi:FlaA1/EpsC-like NDP-sugar epimerase
MTADTGHGQSGDGQPRNEGAEALSKVDVWRVVATRRGLFQCAIDCVAWAVALCFATLLRYDFAITRVEFSGLAILVPAAVIIQGVVGMRVGIYTGRWRFGSFDEVFSLVKAVVVTSLVVAAFNPLWDPRLVPLSVPFVGGAFALVLMSGLRYAWRLAVESRRRPSGEGLHRMIVFGAGEGAGQVIPQLLRDPDSSWLPVALIDDDPFKRNLRIMGVPVVGGRDQLVEAAKTVEADTLLIAMPSAGPELVTELSELGRVAGLTVKVLPSVRELFHGEVDVADIRDVTTADLLGRHEIETDLEAIAGYLRGRRVLVTGAGGSIGSELCRQLYRFAPAQLVMLDRDESALHAVQLSIEGRALLDSPDLVLVDLRDRRAVGETLEQFRPHVIFHAAALKHLTLLERNPAEAVKTNVWATIDLLELAAHAGVERFVNISTDKAADPCSVLGYSKRITERLTSHFSVATGRAYLSVRFGNVLGSRGSVLTTFHNQVERGGPVTVTHPDVTRYFMTVEEAVQLVIQAGAIGRPGEALVLDMGTPVSIAEVARLVAARSERPVSIEFTGLRPGEKLHEVLLAADEVDLRPTHPLISHVPVPPLDPAPARAIDPHIDRLLLVQDLSYLCRADIDPSSSTSGGTSGEHQRTGES